MSLLEWGVELLLVGLLCATIPFALRLERQLGALRRDRAALEGSAVDFGEAARQAEATLLRLRATAEGAGRQVAERVAVAEPVRDDLRYLVERAEAMADRLAALVRNARPLAAAQDGPAIATAAMLAPGPEAASQAERDLLRALRLGR